MHQEHTARSEPGTAPVRNGRDWLEVIPLVWLMVLLAAYAVVALYPLDASPRAEVPEVTQLGLLAVPLWVATMVAGIIRYVGRRSAKSGSPGNSGLADGGAENP